ncbi:MAG: PorT family protein [Winogradskyella sp.]|nr:PorT family protein [Winogradskyella sp.]
MKKSLSILVLAISMATLTFAQTGSGIGLKAGLNYAGNGDYFESASNSFQNPEKNIGYHIGLFGKIGNDLYLRPELVYTKIKTDYDSGEFDMTKIDVPVLVGAKILGPIHVFGGPAFQYILDTEFDGVDIDDVENEFTVGLNFGIGLSFNKIGIDLRYERGFTENEATFFDNNNVSLANRVDTRPEQLILSLSFEF